MLPSLTMIAAHFLPPLALLRSRFLVVVAFFVRAAEASAAGAAAGRFILEDALVGRA